MRLVSSARTVLAVVFAASLTVGGMVASVDAAEATAAGGTAISASVPANGTAHTPLTSVAPVTPVTPVTSPVAVATAQEGPVRLAGMSPQVAAPGQDVTVRIEVHNTTSAAVSPLVEVRVGRALNTRKAVAAHADDPAGDGALLGEVQVTDLAADARTTVTVTLPAQELTLQRPYGALPLTITVAGLPGAAPLGTFVPYQVAKEYEPLRLAAALPITADPDPRVLSGTVAERTAAWTQMLAPGSRTDRVVRAAELSGATVVVDPQLFGPIEEGVEAPAEDPRAAFAERIAGIDDMWVVPPGDPDLSALAATALSPQTPLTRRTDAPLVAWPAGSTGRTVRAAAGDLGQGAADSPAAIILPTPAGQAFTGTAIRRDDTGRRVLLADAPLSHLLSTAAADSGPLLAQHALADSVALLAESPGRARDAFILPGRALDLDPTATAAVLTALDEAPWITPVDADTYLTDEPAGGVVGSGSVGSGGVGGVEADPSAATPPSPLTRENADEVGRLVDLAAGLRPVLPAAVIPADLESTLVSSRWRGHVEDWNDAKSTLVTRLDGVSEGVYVVPSTINFFAEHGALQVTVVNDLDVEVSNVHLTAMVQGRPSRLVVRSEPEPLTIRPRSRTTVRFDVEALAAGLVPLTVSLRTPAGTPLGQDATVDVQVRPTNGWLLLAAGGVVGAIFFFGLLRAIRLGERRVSDSDMRDLDLS